MTAEYFVYKLIPPRPTFALDMSEAEAQVMHDHGGYWQRLLEQGKVVAFGPVLDPAGSWGLAIVRADDEADVRALGNSDPAVTSGTASFDVYPMPGATVLPARTG